MPGRVKSTHVIVGSFQRAGFAPGERVKPFQEKAPRGSSFDMLECLVNFAIGCVCGFPSLP